MGRKVSGAMRHGSFTFEPETLADPPGMRLRWAGGGRTPNFAETLREWRDDPQSSVPFAAAIASMPFESLYWECPVLTPFTAAQPFECVVLEAHNLHRRTPDANAFRDKFTGAAPGVSVIQFKNLSGGSLLVVPLPVVAHVAYGHLAAFLRAAPSDQICAFFASLAAGALTASQANPVWLSTAGDGVPWLHGRIDPYPKYYNFSPYRDRDRPRP